MRADAAGSLERAGRHLFRHLHDARELRANPLAERFFRHGVPDELACEALANAVRAALEACVRDDIGSGEAERAARYRAIVARCDLGGETHRAVWESLGLSRRQFYRERARICRRIARSIACDRRGLRGSGSSTEAFELAFARGQAFVELGAAETGLALLRDIGRQTSERSARIAAWCAAARVLAARWRVDEATDALEGARAHLDTPQNEECDGLDAADVAFTGGEIARYGGRAREAFAAYRRAAPALQRLASYGGRRDRELFVEALASWGDQLAEHGDYAGAFKQFGTARTVLETLERAAPQRTIEVLLGWGLTLSCLPDADNEASVRAFEDAFSKATSLGFVNRSALVSMALASFHWYVGGRRSAAQRHLDAAYALAPALDHRYVRWYVASEGAAIELAFGHGLRALELVGDAERDAPRGSSEWAGAQYTRARALLRTGNARLALQVARTAGSAAGRLTRPGLQGAALRLMAETYAVLGQRQRAVECIGEAIPLLERYGSLNQLALGYRTSAAITGDSGHARRAASIGRTV